MFTADLKDCIPRPDAINVIAEGRRLGQSKSQKDCYWACYEHMGQYYIALNDGEDCWLATIEDIDLYNEIPESP